MCSSHFNGYFKITFNLIFKEIPGAYSFTWKQLYIHAQTKLIFKWMVLYLASDLITRLTASRKGLFNFVVLFSHACNLQTAQSQTSVVNDTFYSSKFHFSGNLVLAYFEWKHISFFLSCQPYSLPVSSRVSSCIDRSAHHPCLHTRTGYQYYPVTLYLYLYQVQRWVSLDMVFHDFFPFLSAL